MMMSVRHFPKLVQYDTVRAIGYSHEDTLELLSLFDEDMDDHAVFQMAYLTARKTHAVYATEPCEEMANDFLIVYRCR